MRNPTTPGIRMSGPSLSRLALRLSTVAAATCGVLSTGLIAPGGAQAATATAATTALAPATVTVAAPARQPTRATLRASRTTVTKGQATRLTAVVTVGSAGQRLAGATVTLQARVAGGSWRNVATRKLTSAGVFTVLPGTSKTRSFRLYVSASSTRLASASNVVTVTVRPTARQKILAAAVSSVGKPYVFGASGPNAFDCSGLTAYAYRKAGVTLPHNADAQKRYGKAVSRSAAKPGDLVVFYSGGYAYHAAIYAGNGYIYEAANPSIPVGRHKIWSGAVGFRRLVA